MSITYDLGLRDDREPEKSKVERDEYGISLDKPWRDVRFTGDDGEPMNLMDWQAQLQTELGAARIMITNLIKALELLCEVNELHDIKSASEIMNAYKTAREAIAKGKKSLQV